MLVTIEELEAKNPRKLTFRLTEHRSEKVNQHNLTVALKKHEKFLKKLGGNFKVETRYETNRQLELPFMDP